MGSLPALLLLVGLQWAVPAPPGLLHRQSEAALLAARRKLRAGGRVSCVPIRELTLRGGSDLVDLEDAAGRAPGDARPRTAVATEREGVRIKDAARAEDDGRVLRIDLGDITGQVGGEEDGSGVDDLDVHAKDAFKGCEYSEVKLKPRERPDRAPRAETVHLWDCLVTAADGTVVDRETSNSGATADFLTQGFLTLLLPSHGVAIQLQRGSAGSFRFRCAGAAPVLEASAQGHWRQVGAGLEGFEHPAAVATLEAAARRQAAGVRDRALSLADGARWVMDEGIQRLRVGKWAVERVWPGSNVCILNLDSGDLQVCERKRGREGGREGGKRARER